MLQALEFQVEFTAGWLARVGNERRADGNSVQALLGKFDVVEADHGNSRLYGFRNRLGRKVAKDAKPAMDW